MNCVTQTILEISIYLRGIYIGWHKLSYWTADECSPGVERENPIISYSLSYLNNIYSSQYLHLIMHGSFMNSPYTNLTEFLLQFHLRFSPFFLCPVHGMEITPLEQVWARAVSSFSWAWQLPLQITSHLPQLSSPLPLCMLLTHCKMPWNGSILVPFLSPSSFCISLGVRKSTHFSGITVKSFIRSNSFTTKLHLCWSFQVQNLCPPPPFFFTESNDTFRPPRNLDKCNSASLISA